MLLLTEEIIRRWSLPFALGCDVWKLTKTGTWVQQCGDVLLRVTLVPTAIVQNPNEGLYTKPWLLGTVKLRIDGAVVPLTEDALAALWVHVSVLLTKHGVSLLEDCVS